MHAAVFTKELFFLLSLWQILKMQLLDFYHLLFITKKWLANVLRVCLAKQKPKLTASLQGFTAGALFCFVSCLVVCYLAWFVWLVGYFLSCRVLREVSPEY